MNVEDRVNRGELIQKAWSLAETYHKGQRYGFMPYIYHIRSVAQKAMEPQKFDFFRDYAVVVTAYLHDIVEDTDYSEEQLKTDFPEEVVNAVLLLTKPKDYADNPTSQEQYLSGILGNELARRVKLADALCNLEESYKSGSKSRVRKYATLVAALSM